MNIFRPLAPFDTVALGSVTTSRPDISGRVLHGILLRVVGTGSPTAAEYLEWVKVSVNTREKLYIVPSVQAQVAKYLNTNDDVLDTDVLFIPLTRPGQLWSAWGTGDISEFAVQAKIVGSNPSGKTLTKIEAAYVYSPTPVSPPRGDVFLQTVLTTPTPVAGWNTLSNVPVNDIITATRMFLMQPNSNVPITEVRVTVGDREVFNTNSALALAALRFSEFYKVPSSPVVFPVPLDLLGLPQEFIPLVENGVRRPLNIEFYWDSSLSTSYTAFSIYLEGIERGAPKQVGTAKA
jgi:hypothetical protein